MFLESSRSKFIGYTLGRWVQGQPSAAILGGGQFGGCFCLCRESLGWLVCGFIPGWSLPHPWVLSPAPSLALFPPPVTPTPWWACPGPSMRASAP